MAWIPVEQSLGNHRKTRQLARELGVDIPTAIGYLVLFWTWAVDNAPSGILTGIEAEDMLPISAHNLDPQTFLKVLISARFVDERGHGKDRRPTLRIHDWEQYGGRLCEARAAHRNRMRQSRALTRVEESRSDKSRGEERRTTPLSPPKRGAGEHSSEIRRVCLEDQDGEAVKLWEVALDTLQGQVTKPNYETWLKASAGYALNGGKLVIVAPNDFAAEWLSTKLRATISKTLTGLLGKPTEVEFVLAEGTDG